jgi:hypothetical protein
LFNHYRLALAKDYSTIKVSDAEIDNRIKAEINRFIGQGWKKVADTN